jgi:hypothetical protein
MRQPTILLLFLLLGTLASQTGGLDIDYHLVDVSGGWVANALQPIWEDVVAETEALLTAEDYSLPAPPLPDENACGPRGVEQVLERHQDAGRVSLRSPDTVAVYVYTDVFTAICSATPTAGYATVCAAHDDAGNAGRPVMGYINICDPTYPIGTMRTLLQHELLHVLGFSGTTFSGGSFPLYGTLDVAGVSVRTMDWVRQHYGCPEGSADDIFGDGIPLAGGPHLHPFVAGDEVMSPCISHSVGHRLTNLTAHVMADLGLSWGRPLYHVDFSAVPDMLLYGYRRGCYEEPVPCGGETHQRAINATGDAGDFRCSWLCVAGGDYVVPVTEAGALALADPAVAPPGVGALPPVAPAAPPPPPAWWVVLVVGLLCVVTAAVAWLSCLRGGCSQGPYVRL